MTPLANRCSAALAGYRQACAAGWRQSLARRWLLAWRTELTGLLPAAVAERLGQRAAPQQVGWPLPADFQPGYPAVLVLNPRQVLAQRISLPLAATRNLREVLSYEIDKYTPYTAEQVHFVARVVRQQPANAEVELVAIASQRLDAVLAACRERRLPLLAVDVQGSDGQRLGVDLLPPGSDTGLARPSRLDQGLWLGLAACCLVLIAGFINQRQDLVAAMEQQVASQRQAVQHIEQLRQALDSSVGAASYLASRKAGQPTVTALLADLSTCLGDETSVEQLEVHEAGEVTFSGQSARSSAMIAQLKACKTLEHAQFQGVILPDKATGQERFSISAQLKREVPHAPAQP